MLCGPRTIDGLEQYGRSTVEEYAACQSPKVAPPSSPGASTVTLERSISTAKRTSRYYAGISIPLLRFNSCVNALRRNENTARSRSMSRGRYVCVRPRHDTPSHAPCDTPWDTLCDILSPTLSPILSHPLTHPPKPTHSPSSFDYGAFTCGNELQKLNRCLPCKCSTCKPPSGPSTNSVGWPFR